MIKKIIIDSSFYYLLKIIEINKNTQSSLYY